MTTTAPRQRRKAGRKAKSPDGAPRDKIARATLTAGERERHEAWLTSQGWPEVPEADIVRKVLEEKWAAAPIAA